MCRPDRPSRSATRAFISTSLRPVAAPQAIMASGNSQTVAPTCPGRTKAAAIDSEATGSATRPSRAPSQGATSIAVTAASGVMNSKSPSADSSTPSIALVSGSSAANPPQTTPMAAKTAKGARARENRRAEIIPVP